MLSSTPGRSDNVINYTDVGVNAHLEVFPVKLNALGSSLEVEARGHNELHGGPAQGNSHVLELPFAIILGHTTV